MTPIAQLVRTIRKKSKLSQKQLADLAGVGKTVVFDIEHGKDTVKWDTLKKIFDALNITLTLTHPLINPEEASRD
jgi:HTH-type transcriptional regulator / antitoxin HipB